MIVVMKLMMMIASLTSAYSSHFARNNMFPSCAKYHHQHQHVHAILRATYASYSWCFQRIVASWHQCWVWQKGNMIFGAASQLSSSPPSLLATWNQGCIRQKGLIVLLLLLLLLLLWWYHVAVIAIIEPFQNSKCFAVQVMLAAYECFQKLPDISTMSHDKIPRLQPCSHNFGIWEGCVMESCRISASALPDSKI